MLSFPEPLRRSAALEPGEICGGQQGSCQATPAATLKGAVRWAHLVALSFRRAGGGGGGGRRHHFQILQTSSVGLELPHRGAYECALTLDSIDMAQKPAAARGAHRIHERLRRRPMSPGCQCRGRHTATATAANARRVRRALFARGQRYDDGVRGRHRLALCGVLILPTRLVLRDLAWDFITTIIMKLTYQSG